MTRFATMTLVAFAILQAMLLSVTPTLADYVGNLNPNGDNYLTLRQYATAKSREISRMGPGTIVEILDADGDWFYIQTQDGRIGWAHGNYILPGFPGGNTPRPDNAAPFGVVNDEAGDVPVEDYQEPAVAGGIASGAADVGGVEFDWLEGHMTQFHDPLKYYP